MKSQVVKEPATPAATTPPQTGAPAVGIGTSAPGAAVIGTSAPITTQTQAQTPAPAPAAGAPAAAPSMPGGGMPGGGMPGGGSPGGNDFSPSSSSGGPGGGSGLSSGGGGPGGYAGITGEEAYLGSKLSCKRDGKEACTGVELKLGPAPIQTPGNPDKQAFINWLKPAALYIQAQTGLPASIIIGQAAVETGWGTSTNFTKRNSMFGHSCWNGASQTGQTQIGPNHYTWKGDCAANRPANEGGKYLVFANKENSLLAYLQNILMSRGRYKGVQAEVKRASTGESPGIGDWSTIIKDIAASGYAADKNYMMTVGGAITNQRLDQLNGGDCQICIHQQRKNGNPVRGTGGAADTTR